LGIGVEYRRYRRAMPPGDQYHAQRFAVLFIRGGR
jgi:hypothetical protein